MGWIPSSKPHLTCMFPRRRKLHTFPMTSHVECVAILEPAVKGL